MPDHRRAGAPTFDEFCPYRTDGLCRCGCGAKARRVWASNACSDAKLSAWHIRCGRSDAIRRAAFARDAGVCAICQLDTALARARAMPGRWGAATEEERALTAERIRQGFPSPGRRKWWEADHIIPLIDGGENDMANIRTLCIPCHKTVTREAAGRRARARRIAARGTTAPFALA